MMLLYYGLIINLIAEFVVSIVLALSLHDEEMIFWAPLIGLLLLTLLQPSLKAAKDEKARSVEEGFALINLITIFSGFGLALFGIAFSPSFIWPTSIGLTMGIFSAIVSIVYRTQNKQIK